MLMGDSTQRRLYESVQGIMQRVLGFRCLVVQPHVDRMPIRDRDGHKDYDTICLQPPAPHARTRGSSSSPEDASLSAYNGSRKFVQKIPECVDGPPRPGRSCVSVFSCGRCPTDEWTSRAAIGSAVVLSFRFLRGLDGAKLAANARDWRQKFAYSEWRFRSKTSPPTMFMQTDDVAQHPVTRMHLAHRIDGPDLILFHSGAWDLPKMNRSNYYWPYMIDFYLRDACATQQQQQQQQQRSAPPIPQRYGRTNVTAGITFWREVAAFGSPCVRRGHELTNDEIYKGFDTRLRLAVGLLRDSAPLSRIVLRTCHSGTQPKSMLKPSSLSTTNPTLTIPSRRLNTVHPNQTEPQLDGLMRMNAIIGRVAAAFCIDVLDAFATDEAAGFFFARLEDFHVPPAGSTHAALALLAQLVGMRRAAAGMPAQLLPCTVSTF